MQKFDEMMMQSAKSAESWMDKMAGIKGQINARAARSRNAS